MWSEPETRAEKVAQALKEFAMGAIMGAVFTVLIFVGSGI